MAYPINVWMVDESEFDSFTFTGGKVIYVAEDIDIRFKNHPSIMTAGALLAPCDAIECILDNELEYASQIYYDYLLHSEANMYTSIVLAAAIQGVPLGIMFGVDEINMHYPTMLLNFLYHTFGIVVGVTNKVAPYIEDVFMPNDLAHLYMMNLINYETFMEKHPVDAPISEIVVSKMACEEHPLVGENKDFQHYYEYFNNVKNSIHLNNNGKFLIDFMEGV